jgi:FAD-linked oxidoreductase
MTDHDTRRAWRNWAGNQRGRATLAVPSDRAALAARVASARGPVRIAGAGHSFSPLLAGADTIIDLSAMRGPEIVSTCAGTARLNAGSRLRALSFGLDRAGLAFRNLGDIDAQTLAGAMATGTHGTGATLPSLSGEMIGATLMTGTGEIVEIAARDVPGARVSLGLLGILLEIEMRVVPAHVLRRRVRTAPAAETLERMHDLWAGHRQFEFFWIPQSGRAVEVTHDVAAAPEGRAPFDTDELSLRALRIARTLGRRAPWLRRGLVRGLMALQGEEEFAAQSWKVLTKPRATRFVEMEYHLPPPEAADALAALMGLIETRHPDVFMPVEVRQTAGDDGWLSPFQGGPRVSVAVHAAADDAAAAVFRDAEAIFRTAGGRPHWGKVHGLTSDDVAALYPDHARFEALRRRLDPDGRFLTPAMRRLLPAADEAFDRAG